MPQIALRDIPLHTEAGAHESAPEFAAKARRRRHKAGPTAGGKVLKDPKLMFILAGQSILRWQIAAERLQLPARNPTEYASMRIEIELGLAQLVSVADRVRPLAKSRNMAVRFEAEEVMARLDALTARMQDALDAAAPEVPAPVRTALEIRDMLMAKLQSGRRHAQA